MIVIPTRDRSDLAKNAIQSILLGQNGCPVTVLVSDNSTLVQQRESLRLFCEQQQNSRLHYVQPPEPLAMASHWQWAIEQALKDFGAKHFIYLTDRMMFKRSALADVLKVIARCPEHIVSYNHDRIDDFTRPIRVEQTPGTGELLEVQAEHLVRLYSKAELHPSLPRMLNCAVPRTVLEQIASRFKSVFSSISPDFNFCCRALDTVSAIVFYNASPIFHYALRRSTGAGAARGEITPDRASFFAAVWSGPVEEVNPITSLLTVGSSIFYEYSKFRQETSSPRFVDLDEDRCLRYIANEMTQIQNPSLRDQLRRLLIGRGWTPLNEGASTISRVQVLLEKALSPRRVWGKLRRLSRGPMTKPFWRFLTRNFGLPPPPDCRFEFDEIDQAIRYLNDFPGPGHRRMSWQEDFLEAKVLPAR